MRESGYACLSLLLVFGAAMFIGGVTGYLAASARSPEVARFEGVGIDRLLSRVEELEGVLSAHSEGPVPSETAKAILLLRLRSHLDVGDLVGMLNVRELESLCVELMEVDSRRGLLDILQETLPSDDSKGVMQGQRLEWKHEVLETHERSSEPAKFVRVGDRVVVYGTWFGFVGNRFPVFLIDCSQDPPQLKCLAIGSTSDIRLQPDRFGVNWLKPSDGNVQVLLDAPNGNLVGVRYVVRLVNPGYAGDTVAQGEVSLDLKDDVVTNLNDPELKWIGVLPWATWNSVSAAQ